jgi:hypothetical protein
MMTEAIERQLIEWGGEKEATRYAFRTIGGSKACISLDGELYVEAKGNDMRTYGMAAWKTLDDIRRVLDVFGVVCKEPPKWRANGAIALGPDEQVITFMKYGGWNEKAAAEYAAMMNAKESPPVGVASSGGGGCDSGGEAGSDRTPTKPSTVEEWMRATCTNEPIENFGKYRWYKAMLPRKVYRGLENSTHAEWSGDPGWLGYQSREAAIAALEVALRKAGELQ